MITISSLRARDFCRYSALSVPLGGQGLVYVGGHNGVGKSTIYRALTWCLYGKSLSKDEPDKVIRHGQREAVVEVDLVLADGSKATVKRTRKRGVFDLNIRFAGGDVIGKGRAQDVICETLGMDYDAFRNAVLYSQDDVARFANPQVTDGERKAVLHRILRTTLFSKACAVAREMANALAERVRGKETELAVLRAKLTEHDVSALEAAHRSHEEKRASDAEALQGRARAALEEVKTLRAELDSVPDSTVVTREDVKAPAAEAILDARARVSRSDKMAGVLANTLSRLDADLRLLTEDECPTCGTSLLTGSGLDKRHELLASREKTVKLVQENKRETADADKSLRELLDDAESARAAQESATATRLALTRKRDMAEARIASLTDSAKDLIGRVKDVLNLANPHAEPLRKARELVGGYTSRITEVTSELVDARTELAHAQFWVTGFGQQGLPSVVLDGTMAFLTERTNHYLGVLSGGRISVRFSTQRELTSRKGEMRDEICVTPTVDGLEGYEPSHGQQKRIDLASGFALMDLAAAHGGEVGLLMLDEVLDGLDTDGRTSALALLHQLRIAKGSVVVISHESDMEEIFERCWEIKDGDDGAVLEA